MRCESQRGANRTWASAISGMFTAVSPGQEGAVAYTGVYVFGDSLVDSGNALKLAEWYGGLPFTDMPEGAPYADLGYFQGRFSNGYTFADLISNKTIGLVTRPVFPFGFEDPWLGIPIDPFAGDPSGNNLNFAYGGSQIRQGDEVVPDLDGQTDAFKDAVDGHADPNALYIVTIGGNDVRSLAPVNGDPIPEADAYAALAHAAHTLFTELSGLIDKGVHNILITGVPDVGLIPDYDLDGNLVLNATEQMRADAGTNYSIYLDTLIRTTVVPALQALGANVTYVPVMSYVDSNGAPVVGAFDAIIPEIAALHGLTTGQLTSNLLLYQNLVFFDEIHPNAQAHALVGSYMYSQLTGTPWVETMPLSGSDVDYKLTATIGAAGEVDSQSIYLIAGTTYTFEMLGVSSLGAPGSVGDTMLKLLSSSGILVGMDDDSGAGFDANLTFTVASSGTYVLQMSAVGMLTGSYALQAAVDSGAAMLRGNTYTISNASTLVLEGAGGIGQDVVKASVSYALATGSEIEVLRTTNNLGKTAINLTGNEFSQTIIGNNGANVLEGKGGADVMTGGGGNDRFVLSNDAVTNPGAANIDKITDYSAGDVVDITQILRVATGVNVLTGGYLRVTTSGLIQVDPNGGGDHWITLSTINGTGAVTVRYVSGTTATNISVTRVSDSQLSSVVPANSHMVTAAAVAAAGLMSEPAAAEQHAHASAQLAVADIRGSSDMPGHLHPIVADVSRFTLETRAGEIFDNVHSTWAIARAVADASRTEVAALPSDNEAPRHLLDGSQSLMPAHVLATSSFVAPGVVMPSAEMLLAHIHAAGGDSLVVNPHAILAQAVETLDSRVGEVLADALAAGTHASHLDMFLESGHVHKQEFSHLAHAPEAFHHSAGIPCGQMHQMTLFEALAAHHAAAPHG